MTPPRSKGDSLAYQQKLHALCDIAACRVDELFDELGVDAQRVGRMYQGSCPVHGGDNRTAFNLYPDGETVRGHWVCRSHACERAFRPTLVGLVRGVLSRNRHSWEPGCGADRRTCKFGDAVSWLCRFVGRDWKDIRTDSALAEKLRFASSVSSMARARAVDETGGWPRTVVRRRLAIPSPYFLGRGFGAGVLETFDVGDSGHGPLAGRAVVPVYDPTGRRCVGATGRSTYVQCKDCFLFHDPVEPCPEGEARLLPGFAKWRNTPGFARESHLYGYWAARDAVRSTGVVVLAEGPGDVLRLREAGVENCVGLFGVNLTDPQEALLGASGALTVGLLLDTDRPGREAADRIQGALGRTFRVTRLGYAGGGKDVGDLTVPEVRERVVPLVKGLRGY